MNDPTDSYMAYKYIGGHDASGHPIGYIMGVPARDLTEKDVLDIEDKQGITRNVIDASTLYVPGGTVEVQSFCGAELQNGGRCKRPVSAWGERCWQHKES